MTNDQMKERVLKLLARANENENEKEIEKFSEWAKALEIDAKEFKEKKKPAPKKKKGAK